MKKKLMCLGGNYYQMTATKSANKLGYHVISCDYLPNNPAHKYADEYYNVSTTDKEEILKLAKKLDINGVISYASDVSAPTAAYVAEKMNLPTNPYDSVLLLTRKDLFRPFLKNHGFNIPKSRSITNIDDALKFYDEIQRPIMIKPTDASGSKGVNKVNSKNELEVAYCSAKEYSRNGILIVEEFIQRKGYQIAGDAFIVNGKIEVFAIANEHFDVLCNPLVPVGESFPAKLPVYLKEKAKREVQRLVDELGLRQGAINLDLMFDVEDNLYIIEIGPRNGGNLITDAIELSSGINLADYTVMAALGEDLGLIAKENMNKYVSSFIIHSDKEGVYKGINIDETLKSKIKRYDMFVSRGEKIYRFENGGFGIGAMLLMYDSMEEMLEIMEHMPKYVKVIVE